MAPSTITKIKDALTGSHTDNQVQHSSAAPSFASTAATGRDYNDVTGSQSVASTREVADGSARSMAGHLLPHSTNQASTSTISSHQQPHHSTSSTSGHIGRHVPKDAQLTKTDVTSSGIAGTSWRHESHVLTNTMTGLQATPNIPNINTSEMYKDYLPNRNNQWIQSLIQKMDSASIDVDKYAKAQQELVSREASIEVEKIMASNKLRQDALIASMHKRANEFEVEYSRKREALIKQLDKEESVLLEKLQAQLKIEQEAIAAETRTSVEEIARLARDRKMAILGEAQQKQDQLSQTVTTTTTTEVDPTSLTKHHLFGAEKVAHSADERFEHDLVGTEPRMSKNTTTTTTSTGTA